jgi:hypothetical protein
MDVIEIEMDVMSFELVVSMGHNQRFFQKFEKFFKEIVPKGIVILPAVFLSCEKEINYTTFVIIYCS